MTELTRAQSPLDYLIGNVSMFHLWKFRKSPAYIRVNILKFASQESKGGEGKSDNWAKYFQKTLAM